MFSPRSALILAIACLVSLLAVPTRAQVPPPPESPESPEGEEDLDLAEPAPTAPVVPDGILPLREIARTEHGPSDRTRLVLQERKLVLVARSGSVEARDRETGQFSWKLGLPGEVLFPPVLLRAEPLELLLSSSSGRVLLLDGETGNIRREIELGFELALAPLPAGHVSFLGTPAGAIVAVDFDTGTERFRVETGETPLALALGAGLLVVSGAERTLTALSAETGELRWSVRARAGFSAPAVFREGGDRIYIGDLLGEFYCLSSEKGKVEFRWSTGAAMPYPALVLGKRVYATSFGNILYAFDAGGGTEQWRANLPGRPASGPVLVGRRLLVATLDGAIVEVNPERGQVGKSYTAPGELAGPPSFWVASEPPPAQESAAVETASPPAEPSEAPPPWYEGHRVAITLRSGEVLLLGHGAPELEPESESESEPRGDVPGERRDPGRRFEGTGMSFKEDGARPR
jgi:outer membrane protein assembly factor BamB